MSFIRKQCQGIGIEMGGPLNKGKAASPRPFRLACSRAAR